MKVGSFGKCGHFDTFDHKVTSQFAPKPGPLEEGSLRRMKRYKACQKGRMREKVVYNFKKIVYLWQWKTHLSSNEKIPGLNPDRFDHFHSQFWCLEGCSLCVWVCVCVFLHENLKSNRSRITKFEYFNSWDRFDIGHCWIKMKVTVGLSALNLLYNFMLQR